MSDNTLQLTEIHTLKLELAAEKTRSQESSSELRVSYQNTEAELTFAEELKEKLTKSENEDSMMQFFLTKNRVQKEESKSSVADLFERRPGGAA